MSWYATCKSEHRFSCLMAPIHGQTKLKILRWIKDNVSENDVTFNDGADGYETDPHITVFYGLHTSDTSDIKMLMKVFDMFFLGGKSIKAKLGEISVFDSNENFDVLKIDIDSRDLIELHGITKALDHTLTHSEYHPHLTLAYIKKGSCRNTLGDSPFNGKEVEFEDLLFSDQKGNKTKIVV